MAIGSRNIASAVRCAGWFQFCGFASVFIALRGVPIPIGVVATQEVAVRLLRLRAPVDLLIVVRLVVRIVPMW